MCEIPKPGECFRILTDERNKNNFQNKTNNNSFKVRFAFNFIPSEYITEVLLCLKLI